MKIIDTLPDQSVVSQAGAGGYPSKEVLTSMVADVDANVLRMAVLQLTGDPALAQMTVTRVAARGGISSHIVLSEKDAALVREKAVDLLGKGELTEPAPQAPAETRKLIEIFLGQPIPDETFPLDLEELGFADRFAAWNKEPSQERKDAFPIVIVGAGISGIAAAVQLERLGLPYVIYERRSGPGGTWEVNDYPEARVDVTSFVYQYKFDQKYPWPEYFASRAEGRKYLRHIAEKYGVSGKIILETEVTAAEWDDVGQVWQLKLRDRDGVMLDRTARIVISASGLFSTPRIPKIPGVDRFEGQMFHSTEWDHTCDLTGKKVALIGNGSTGTQILRHLAENAAEVAVYQRSAQWIAPTENYRDRVPASLQWLIAHLPCFWNWYCYAAYVGSLTLQELQYVDPEWQAAGGRISEANDALRAMLESYIADQVGGDADLIQKCTPSFSPLARRIIVDNEWYKSLIRDHVELVVEAIDRFDATAIVTVDGKRRDADVIVLAAGFEVAEFFSPIRYRGRGGATHGDVWRRDGPRAFLGVATPGLPNLLTFSGPNSHPRVGGFYAWAEVWSRYVCQLIANLIESDGHSIECKPEIFEKYNLELDAEMKKLVWSQENAGGYFTRDHNRNAIHSPWSASDYHSRMRVPDMGNYDIK